MADTLVKPIERGLQSVDVVKMSAKQTSQRVQRKIVGPPDLDRSARKLIAQPSLTTKSELEIELAELDRAWRSISPSTTAMPSTFIWRPFSQSSCDGGVSTAL